MAKTNTWSNSLVASQSLSAGSTVRARVDSHDQYGGILTWKITNGSTGPTAPCFCNIYVAYNDTMPAAEAEGTNWKRISRNSAGIMNDFIAYGSYRWGPEVGAVMVEFTGNATSAVTIESAAGTWK